MSMAHRFSDSRDFQRTRAPVQSAVAPSRAGSPWELVLACLAGLIFSAGLTLGGMTDPRRVQAFLDMRTMLEGPFPGNWDPTLGLVMLGAVAVSLLAFWLTPSYSRKPWAARDFVLPSPGNSDARLLIGAVLFGIGWGMSGYCPGPVLASLLTGHIDIAIFVLSMLPGMYLARKV